MNTGNTVRWTIIDDEILASGSVTVIFTVPESEGSAE